DVVGNAIGHGGEAVIDDQDIATRARDKNAMRGPATARQGGITDPIVVYHRAPALDENPERHPRAHRDGVGHLVVEELILCTLHHDAVDIGIWTKCRRPAGGHDQVITDDIACPLNLYTGERIQITSDTLNNMACGSVAEVCQQYPKFKSPQRAVFDRDV